MFFRINESILKIYSSIAQKMYRQFMKVKKRYSVGLIDIDSS